MIQTTKLKTKVSPNLALALRRSRIVVDRSEVFEIGVDTEVLTDAQLNLVATSVDPEGSGRLHEVIFCEDEVCRCGLHPLRAWPLTVAGILEALGCCPSGCWKSAPTRSGTMRWSDARFIPSAATQAGAFALATGSRTAALLVTLKPGSYTAQVKAAQSASSSVALIEIYEVP